MTSGTPGREAPAGAPMFAGHASKEGGEYACAGWLAAVGHEHLGVRLAVAMGRLDPAALSPARAGGSCASRMARWRPCRRSWVRPVQDSLVMKYLARGVPANFLPIKLAKSSTELRGRWFTTMCWAFPAALRVTVTTTLVGSPRI
jgi:hypothetical protein